MSDLTGNVSEISVDGLHSIRTKLSLTNNAI